jgi:dihydroorotate dehydrogenase
MIDLGTTYLGMRLRTPLVASASPLSQELDGIRRLEDAGASAVVLYSLFEEQLSKKPRNLNTIFRLAPRVLQSLSLTFLSPANSAPVLTLI